MPKLDTPTARAVNNAEGSASTLFEEDEYVLKLDKVEVASRPDKNGDPAWIWTFTAQSGQVTGDKFKGKSLRQRTGLAENQLWYLKMFFDAFEVKPNVNTDTLLGKEVKGIIGQREIQAGPRKGQMASDIQTLLPLSASTGDDEKWDDDKADEDEEPDF